MVCSARTVAAPFQPAVGYGFAAAFGVLLVALGLAMQRHSRDGIIFAGVALYLGFTAFVAILIFRIPRTIQVYEHGLERKIPRGFNKSCWLPWSSLIQYMWEGDVIRYTWGQNAVIVLANGRDRSSWPAGSFPKAARIPADQVSEVAALVRHHAPPPR